MTNYLHPFRLVRNLLAGVVIMAMGLSAFPASTQAAEGVMDLDQTIDVNELGDATIVIRMSFNASQFQAWQQRYGMNPSLLKREMAKEMTPYDITDFKLDKNDMDREVTLTIKARGVTTYRGNGRSEIEVPKSWRLVDQDEHELKFNYLESTGNGVMVQGHITAILPVTATDISDPVPAEGGMKRITYVLPVAEASSTGLVLGIVLAAVGVVLSVLGLVKGKADSAAAGS